MVPEEVQKLRHGIYRVHFHDDDPEPRYGYSLATVGSTSSGERWLAPCNWIGHRETRTRSDGSTFDAVSVALVGDGWADVERVELVEAWGDGWELGPLPDQGWDEDDDDGGEQ